MIKKYFEFLKENISEIEAKNHSLGEWVENLCENNKEILELIKPYMENTNPSVRISNTINVLNSNDKRSVYKIINDYLNDNGKTTDVRTFVDFTNESSEVKEIEAGQNVFKTFLKIITSLGLKDVKPSWSNLPDDYLLFFEYKSDYRSAMEKLERFPSLSMFKEKLPKDNCNLYYGIMIVKGERKIDLNFNFGFRNDKIIKIGSFKVNNSSFKKLAQLESPSSAHLRKELAYLTYDKLRLLGDAANHMKTYHPGDTEDRSFKIEDGVLEFGYKGLGKWTDGKMDDQERDRLRKGFTEHLLKFGNKHQIEASVKPDEKSWIRLNVRIKENS
jgi:hypothetical protein